MEKERNRNKIFKYIQDFVTDIQNMVAKATLLDIIMTRWR